ncbi:MAG: hypothetical protein J0I06_15990 [Planctomycetes bacterium]|nr:hypothetical protein [Planctomycetota bacterium]
MGRLSYGKRIALVVASVLLVTGAAVAVWGFDSPFWEWNSKIKIERDPQPPFQIDPDQPYEITLWELALPGVSEQERVIHSDGRVVATRNRYAVVGSEGRRVTETATFTIPPEARTEILDAVGANRIMRLHRSYTYTDMFDGCWRGIAIKQGGRVKAIGCRNYFPEEFERFRRQVETILSGYQENVKWQEVKWPER